MAFFIAFFIYLIYNNDMRLNNIWLIRAREKLLMKIVGWAQRNRIKVENLTTEEVKLILGPRLYRN